MGVVARLFERRSGVANPDAWLLRALGYRPAASGAVVNEQTALTNSAVWACVTLIAESVASLPLPVYRSLPGGGKQKLDAHPAYRLLNGEANPEITSFTLRETLQAHVLTWGNGYAEIELDAVGRPRALWPLLPNRTRADRTDGRLTYYTRPVEGGPEYPLSPAQVLHIHGLGFDGLRGYSVIAQARESIGLALATEEFGARFFGNGASVSGVLEHPGKLGVTGVQQLREAWSEMHTGLANQHRIAVLEEGMKYQRIGIPPEDAQFLETRRFQRGDIASWFKVPPHMIGDLDRATFSNIEHQSIEFVVRTLAPWFVRWEQECNRRLLLAGERGTLFFKYLIAALLRGDINSRYAAYAVGRSNGWLSADDIRDMEEMNPLPNGEGALYLVPLNMVPTGQVLNPPEPMAPPAPSDPGGVVNTTRALPAGETRGVQARRRLARAYERVFADAAKRVLRREEADVMREARKQLATRDAQTFNAWLDQFYREHPRYTAEQFAAAYHSYAQAIAAEAGDEIDADGTLTPELERFVRDLVAEFSGEHATISYRQLYGIANRADADPDADPIVALQQRFDEWRAERPGLIAGLVTVFAGAAVARAVWRRHGVRKLRWYAFGVSCPFCSNLSGRIVGIDDAFLEEGQEFQPEGAASPLRPRKRVAHAPAHNHCDCSVAPA